MLLHNIREGHLPVNDLDKIIKGCQSNKRKAQMQLYHRFAPKMLGVCMRYCKSHAEAEDCLQEAFIRVFSKIHLFAFKGSFEGWVRRIVVNTVIEHYRKKPPETVLDEFPVVKDEADEEEVPPLVSQQELMLMVQNLPPKYRIVFNMYAIEGFTHQEIAEEMGISEGTSKSNLSRARQWLRKSIESKLKGENTVLC